VEATVAAITSSETPLARAFAALAAGEPVLVHDAPDREGETDLLYAAQHVGPEQVRYLRRHGGGLIFLAVARAPAERLGLPFMADVFADAVSRYPALAALEDNDIPYDARSAFSVALNHRDTFTGITDRDRALTAHAFAALVAETADTEPAEARQALGRRFRAPGHVPVCIAAHDPFATRSGHTELAVALTMLAGLGPVALGCEMLSDDGGALSPAAAREWAARRGHPFLEGREVVAAWQQNA